MHNLKRLQKVGGEGRPRDWERVGGGGMGREKRWTVWEIGP